MADANNNAEIEEREDEATSSRTLDEIETEEKIPAETTESTLPAPDEGVEREDDSAGLM